MARIVGLVIDFCLGYPGIGVVQAGINYRTEGFRNPVHRPDFVFSSYAARHQDSLGAQIAPVMNAIRLETPQSRTRPAPLRLHQILDGGLALVDVTHVLGERDYETLLQRRMVDFRSNCAIVEWRYGITSRVVDRNSHCQSG